MILLYCLPLILLLIQSSQCQSESLEPCTVDEGLVKKLKDFRFRKETTNAAIIMKIEKQQVVIDEEYEDISPEKLKNELPDRQPRFIVYSYKYLKDNRLSYSFCFIFYRPAGSKPEQEMIYSRNIDELVKKGGFTKVFDIRSREELTEELLEQKLGFFSR